MNRIEIEEWLARPAKLPERSRLIAALEYYTNACERLERELARVTAGHVELDPIKDLRDE